jgi:aminoglycoside 2'-N-acetyltransferase I
LPDYPGVTEQRTIHELTSDALNSQQIAQVRQLLWAAFERDEHGGFDEDDWQHALGGSHFLAELDGVIVAHASVVERSLQLAGVPLRTGYVEAVATLPEVQGNGHGSALMREVNRLIATDYELGALGTGSQAFYERLGWQIWRGPSSVRTDGGEVRTPDEDGYIMALIVPNTPPIDIGAPISCEWRAGDVW